jgi:hypothetical protein
MKQGTVLWTFNSLGQTHLLFSKHTHMVSGRALFKILGAK